jgi:multidrug resistance efflux pump
MPHHERRDCRRVRQRPHVSCTVDVDAQIDVQHAQINASQAQVNQAQAALVFAQQQATRYQDLAEKGSGTVQNAQQFTSQLHQQEAALQTAQANLELTKRQLESLTAQRMSAEATLAQAKTQQDQAQVNLERTRILSPVDGYVTNLLAQLGDYVNVGANTISLVDADSFWVDGYFEETNLAPIRVGDRAQIALMGHSQIVRGRVDSIARAINVANAQPNNQGVATGHLEKFLSPSPRESDSLTACGHGRMERASHGAEEFFRC